MGTSLVSKSLPVANSNSVYRLFSARKKKYYVLCNGKSKIPTQNLHSMFLTYSWHRDRYNLSLECNNLFDARVYDNYMLQKPGRAFFFLYVKKSWEAID